MTSKWKRPDVSERNRKTNTARFKGKKRPDISERMKRMKRPDVSERNKKRTGEKNPMFGKTHPARGKKRPEVSGEKNPMWGKKCPEHSERMKGEKNPMFGKKRPEVSEYIRKKMLNGFSSYMNSCNKSPSKPQIQLFEMVKILYPSAILNYPHKNYSIDIAIPEPKIAIEFDGYYWHKGREDIDKERQQAIEKDGWKFIRYKKIPNSNELSEHIKNL